MICPNLLMRGSAGRRLERESRTEREADGGEPERERWGELERERWGEQDGERAREREKEREWKRVQEKYRQSEIESSRPRLNDVFTVKDLYEL